jgi:predicted O-methyltransferase YrrM
MADNPRLTLTANSGSVSMDANPLLLDRIEDALLELGSWQELRDVSSRHVEWDGSPRASLRLFQAHSALGFPEPAAEAMKYTISRLNEQPDAELLGMAARVAEGGEHWAALLELRALQWVARPESAGLRLKWHQALRRVALGEDAAEAVSLAWQHRELDPQALARVVQWLASGKRWLELAHLRSLEAADSADPGPALVGRVEALHRAGTLRPDDEAVRDALAAARASPDLSQEFLRKASEWKCAWLVSEIRLSQLASGAADPYELIGHHLNWLKERGHAGDAGAFLDRVAAMDGFAAEDARSLRRLMLREGRYQGLEQCLRRKLAAAPRETGLMLELAELADVRGCAAEASEWIARARGHLLAGTGTGDEGSASGGAAAEVEASWIRAAGSSWIAQHVQAPVTKCPAPKLMPVIELLAAMTQRRGRFPIWNGYGTSDVKSGDRLRAPNDVRIAHRIAVFLAHLARQARPRLIVEIGTAFGVSGMYWASALEEIGAGELVTFEPNSTWRQIAELNIAAISPRARLIDGTFEDRVEAAGIAAGSIDILSIDAIHTPEAVASQLRIAAPFLGEKAVILVDDIRFSAEMYEYWRAISAAPSVEGSLEIESRLGVIAGYPPGHRRE